MEGNRQRKECEERNDVLTVRKLRKHTEKGEGCAHAYISLNIMWVWPKENKKTFN